MSDVLSKILYSGAIIAFEMAANEFIDRMNKKRSDSGLPPLSNEMITGIRSTPAFMLLVVYSVYGSLGTKDPSQAVMLQYFIKKLFDKKYLKKNATGQFSVA